MRQHVVVAAIAVVKVVCSLVRYGSPIAVLRRVIVVCRADFPQRVWKVRPAFTSGRVGEKRSHRVQAGSNRPTNRVIDRESVRCDHVQPRTCSYPVSVQNLPPFLNRGTNARPITEVLRVWVFPIASLKSPAVHLHITASPIKVSCVLFSDKIRRLNVRQISRVFQQLYT